MTIQTYLPSVLLLPHGNQDSLSVERSLNHARRVIIALENLTDITDEPLKDRIQTALDDLSLMVNSIRQ